MEKKVVFVAASLTGGREAQRYVKFIVEFFQGNNFEVPSVHNAADDPNQAFCDYVQDPNAAESHHSMREFDNKWIEEAYLFVAEVSTPSHGVGGEFEHCRLKLRLGLDRTPMLCVSLKGKTVSPYLLGLSESEKNWIWFRSYENEVELASILEEFLEVRKRESNVFAAHRRFERMFPNARPDSSLRTKSLPQQEEEG